MWKLRTHVRKYPSITCLIDQCTCYYISFTNARSQRSGIYGGICGSVFYPVLVRCTVGVQEGGWLEHAPSEFWSALECAAEKTFAGGERALSTSPPMVRNPLDAIKK